LDDEHSIAELLAEMIEILGHSPTVCTSPRQAIELLKSHTFDLVLSDFRMPTMNGKQFYEKACQMRPELARRVVFLTGDVVCDETQSFLKALGNPHLSKPFQLSKVEAVLNQMLGSKLAIAG